MIIEITNKFHVNTESLQGWTKEMFIEAFKGHVFCDINDAWEKVKDHLEPPKFVSKSKKSNEEAPQ